MQVFLKDPDAVLDYGFDWATNWLGADTILTSSWVVPAGLTLDSDSVASGVTTAWLSGGIGGTDYTVTNRITTAGGRTDDRSFVVKVVNR